MQDEGDILIELRVTEDVQLDSSHVCVIHRLHRYDKATIHIDKVIQPLDRILEAAEPLGDSPIVRCVIANGPWPDITELTEQVENSTHE